MQDALARLSKLDLSPLVPKRYRAKAKAVGTGVLALVALAVQFALIDAGTGALITTGILGALSVIGVHQTSNRRSTG